MDLAKADMSTVSLAVLRQSVGGWVDVWCIRGSGSRRAADGELPGRHASSRAKRLGFDATKIAFDVRLDVRLRTRAFQFAALLAMMLLEPDADLSDTARVSDAYLASTPPMLLVCYLPYQPILLLPISLRPPTQSPIPTYPETASLRS
eukprot:3940838-Rhodomonas_salina.4